MTRKSRWLTKEGQAWAEDPFRLKHWAVPETRNFMNSWGDHARKSLEGMRLFPFNHNTYLCHYNEARRHQARFAYLLELLLEQETSNG